MHTHCLLLIKSVTVRPEKALSAKQLKTSSTTVKNPALSTTLRHQGNGNTHSELKNQIKYNFIHLSSFGRFQISSLMHPYLYSRLIVKTKYFCKLNVDSKQIKTTASAAAESIIKV